MKLIITTFVFLQLTINVFAQEISYSVIELKGSATVNNEQLKIGSNVSSGSVVKTENKSFIILVSKDGAKISIGPNRSQKIEVVKTTGSNTNKLKNQIVEQNKTKDYSEKVASFGIRGLKSEDHTKSSIDISTFYSIGSNFSFLGISGAYLFNDSLAFFAKYEIPDGNNLISLGVQYTLLNLINIDIHYALDDVASFFGSELNLYYKQDFNLIYLTASLFGQTRIEISDETTTSNFGGKISLGFTL